MAQPGYFTASGRACCAEKSYPAAMARLNLSGSNGQTQNQHQSKNRYPLHLCTPFQNLNPSATKSNTGSGRFTPFRLKFGKRNHTPLSLANLPEDGGNDCSLNFWSGLPSVLIIIALLSKTVASIDELLGSLLSE